MKSSALSRYLDRHADKLNPEQKQFLARLPDGTVELVHAVILGDAEMPDDSEDIPAWRDCMRRNAPALASLSDDEINLVLAIAEYEFEQDKTLGQRLYAKRGISACGTTERNVAYHEAGHAVVAAAHGFGVKQASIEMNWMEESLGRIHAIHPDGSEYVPNWGPDTAVADDLDAARILIAGETAEATFAGSMKQGTTSEWKAAYNIVAVVAQKTGTAAGDICKHTTTW